MSNNKNCINCGAPIESETVKCPFCGTSYFDFTNIDLGSPVMLKIKHNDKILLVKAMCTSMSITSMPETVSCDRLGSMLDRVVTNMHREIDISFVGVN